ncbi:MAG TPA: ADP-ribosylglycohydrolase family protein [Tepidisphaeraceae bacterium]|jgi:poly(ADP-ribose) glycohydrolase ARH3|nr:ADP-ribosylglycohydrolase family protein [Tepidisphaeraceae bacterium]
MPTLNLQDKFRGCLLGAMIGDVVGAVVEAESPAYIAKTYRTVDEILCTRSVPEFTGPDWQVGRFTDDTQMMIAVAEWLLEDDSHSPEKLLARFSEAYEPWRRYGSGTASILGLFRQYPAQWRELATSQFPHGSHGNGSAMRVAPVGLAYVNDLKSARKIAIESSRPTHSHPLAYQGATLQCIAVAMAAAMTACAPDAFLSRLRGALRYFSDLMQSTTEFEQALAAIEQGLARNASCLAMSTELGTGVTAREAVPMAIYCFLRHPDSFADVIHNAIFIGGDADTIACMAGAISGAFLGKDAIPSNWISAVREAIYSPARIEELADRLFAKYAD